MTVLSLFDGISCGQVAIKQLIEEKRREEKRREEKRREGLNLFRK